MTDIAMTHGGPRPGAPKLHERPPVGARIVFIAMLALGLGYCVYGLRNDIVGVGETVAFGAFVLLGLALLIALGFEFVNGFHDTANAVATVIYTHSLPPVAAVVYSGALNLIGVLLSTGAVAFTIITLLPVELILQVGSQAGYAMIFALLLAAILWNLGTWWFGIPNSSSHALIGSIMGVGLANQLMAPASQATSGVDWNQAAKVFQALLFSPVLGFIASGLLLLVLKLLVRSPKLYEEPKSDQPPPWWIRGLLILTCGGVSFAHGSNDGQKGMGLIMLILIGAAPTAYALNRTMPDSGTPAFVASADAAQRVYAAHAAGAAAPSTDAARAIVGEALRSKTVDTPQVFGALGVLSGEISSQVRTYGSVRHVPAAATPNLRNDMYLTSAATAGLLKVKGLFTADETTKVKAFSGGLDKGTRFIPTWVKVGVAIALGLGTMVGWKRIVVTVGEKIGKTHLTYGQGAAAEIVAAVTILLADWYKLPVSTTHILSSGVAGTMAANRSGLQAKTLLNIALAWVLTLPAAITLAGALYFILRHVF
jgi:PiT family inorganic phosphate transporter